MNTRSPYRPSFWNSSLAFAARVIIWLEDAVIFVVAIALIAAVMLEVVSRHTPGDVIHLAWTDELANSLMPWLTFIGAAILERSRDHIRVTIVLDLLGPSGKVGLTLFSDIFCSAFLILVLLSTFATLKTDLVTTLLTMPVPLAFVSASLAVGTVAMLIHLAARIWIQLSRLIPMRQS